MTGVVVLLVTLAVAAVAGLAWQRANGRFRRTSAADTGDSDALPADLAEVLGVDPVPATATLLQFSSAFCAPCRATRQVLARVAADVPGVRHVEVDAEAHLDAVRRLDILRTPTVLVLDDRLRVVRRASGAPRYADVVAAVGACLSAR